MHPGCRISRVRPKDSALAEVIPLKTKGDDRRQILLANVHRVLDSHGDDLDGFALVVWGRDNQSTCQAVGGARMPSILVPDFVRARLLAHRICRWAEDDVMERLGYGPPTAS